MAVTNDQRTFALQRAEDLDVVVIAEARDHTAWHEVLAAQAPDLEAARGACVLTVEQAAAEAPTFDGVALIVDALDKGRSLAGMPHYVLVAQGVKEGRQSVTVLLAPPVDEQQTAARVVRGPAGAQGVTIFHRDA